MIESWSEDLPVSQIRIARPTHQLAKVVRFYTEGLGLKAIGSFENHEGYSGVMIGLPGHAYHLEFTEHERGSPCPAPTKDNLLIFYIPERQAIERVVARLSAMGYAAVKPENPYWAHEGVTIEDPDGWRIVLMNTQGIVK